MSCLHDLLKLSSLMSDYQLLKRSYKEKNTVMSVLCLSFVKKEKTEIS